MRILVVEDNPAQSAQLKSSLETRGHTVVLAGNGVEALARARADRPDVIASDILMPGMDGFHLCWRIRGDPELSGMPVVLMSASPQTPADRAFATGVGADAYVQKGLSPEGLNELLRRVVARQPKAGTARTGPLMSEHAFRELHGHWLLDRLILEAAELEQANQALREAEARCRAIAELVSDYAYAYRVDPGGTTTLEWVTDAYTRITGYTPEEVDRAGAWKRVIHPEDWDVVASHVDRMFAGEAGCSEYRIVTKAGEVRWLRDSFRPEWDDARGRLVRVFGAAEDITERRERERQLEASVKVASALRAADDRAEMLPVLLEQVAELLGADGAALAMRDVASNDTVIELANGRWAGWTGLRLRPGEGVSGHVIASGRPYVNGDVRNDARMTHLDQLGGLHAVACVPLSTREQTIGALWMGRTHETCETEVRLLTAIAEMAASAIHRATLHEQTERRLRHLTALRSIDMAITASLDLRVTLGVVLDQVLSQLGLDAAGVLLLDAHHRTLEHVAGRGFRGAGLARARVRMGQGHAGRAALERRIVHVPDREAFEQAFVRFGAVAAEGFEAYFGVPLVAKGQVKGVLELFHRGPLAPDPEWLNVMEAFAGQAAVAIDNAGLFDGLQRSNLELAVAYESTLEGWSRALDLRDKETEGHTQRVTELAVRLARAMGMGEAELVHVRRGALLHDIGKMGIPDHVLLKPGPLTDDEWAVMRRHPAYAHEMLAPIVYLRPALDIPYAHHERWDGSGYPRGLKGEQIPLAARVFAVADVWDALRSDRPYRPAWPETEVREHIRMQSGRHFDPRVVEAFLSAYPESPPPDGGV